jgi:hypothetical protein
MTLGEKQELFSRLYWRLLRKAEQLGYGVRQGEVYRPREMAAIYAAKGLGIKDSNHTRKIAADIILSVDGTVAWSGEPYQKLGDYWKSLHPLCRWGGDFRHIRDVYHFSLEHRGIK